mmetsp:Transcript_8336/g.9247  ORF Transcript_8336/g.9247 Transcript_8336/m.9247 type:complete len:225 (+) Transcript_8336:118-792(+)
MKTTSLLMTVAAASIVDPSAAFSPQKQQAKTQQQQQQQEQQEQQTPEASSSRRVFFGKVVADSAVAIVGSGILQHPEPAHAAIKTGAANSFTGDYDDPNHPGCLRQVKIVGGPLNGSGTRSAYPVMEITGWDGDGNNKTCTTRPPSRDSLWLVKGSVRSPSTALVDFSRRGGPAEPFLVTYESGGLVFPDGNQWKKIPEQKDRRPKDLSTLSDGPKSRERDDDD